jgi:transposase
MGMFKEPLETRGQMVLMPRCLDEMIDDDDPVRLLNEAMDRLDYSRLEASYPGGGCPAYAPRVLVKVLALAYAMGVRSSRKIAQLLRVDLRYIWLSENMRPDFRTLARFRREKWRYLEELLVESGRLCQELGLVSLGHVAIDGSKLESAAGRESLWDTARIDRERGRIRQILDEAESVDAAEDKELGEVDNTVLPDEMRDAEARRRRIDEAQARLTESGKRMVSLSDPESRQMKTRDGIRMCYNVQAAVDSQSQVVVGMRVTQDETDRGQLGVMLERVYETTGCKPAMASMDKGYYSPTNLIALEEKAQRGAIGVPRVPANRAMAAGYGLERFEYNEETDAYRCPCGKLLTLRTLTRRGNSVYGLYVCGECKGCAERAACVAGGGNKRLSISVVSALRERMKAFLASDEGKQATRMRRQVVEPVFGQLKQNRGFRRFLLRGLEGAIAESALAFLAHNLLKASVGLRLQTAC